MHSDSILVTPQSWPGAMWIQPVSPAQWLYTEQPDYHALA